MSTRARVETLAVRLGAIIRINGDARRGDLDVEVAAPDGKHWESGVHALVGAQDIGEPASEVWQDILDRMHEGLFPCSDACND